MEEPISSSQRWRRVKQVFQEAIEIPAAGRAAYLSDACAGDPALLAEVQSMIAAHERPGGFLDTPVIDLAATDFNATQSKSLEGGSFGRYQILSLLGSGGMGEVYRARDANLGREVAVKVLPSKFSVDRDRLRRFEQEARAASALNHPNIITIHEFGREQGIHFIVSEYIEGETLRRRMMGGRLQPREIVEIAIQIAGALQAAHELGIIHRDIKPENVMARPDGLVKVLDFGLAKLIKRPPFGTSDAAGEATTASWNDVETGAVMGTVNYMSPEQARGQGLDQRTDLFSLGVVLYEMAAGRSPFTNVTAADAIASILEKEPPALSTLAPETPARLEQIIVKSLRKDREQRYQKVDELLSDLKALKRDLEFEGERERLVAAREEETGGTSLLESFRKFLKSRRFGAFLILLFMIAVNSR